MPDFWQVSVVIPVYNSDQILDALTNRLETALTPICKAYEVILVNDGSADQSWQVITRLARQHSWIHGINLMRNYGQHNALLCGILAARYETVVTMDDDLQHPPEEILPMLEKLSEGYDVVFGTPQQLPHSWWRNLFSIFIKRALSFVMRVPHVRDISSFRAFRTDLRQAFDHYQNPNVMIDVLLSWATNRFATVMVQEAPRQVGKSGYSLAKLFQMAMLILTAYSTAPLRLTSTLGFIFTLFGIGVFIYVIAVYFLLGSIPGFPFLASLIALFGGMQLFALGIIGEYLARIFDRSMDRPVFLISEQVQQQPDKHQL